MTASDHLSDDQFSYEDDHEGPGSHIIRHPKGYIDYQHSEASQSRDGLKKYPSANSVYWADSDEKGLGTRLVGEMMKRHPADEIHLGDVSESGDGLGKKIASLYPDKRVTRADPRTGANKRYRPRKAYHRTGQ